VATRPPPSSSAAAAATRRSRSTRRSSASAATTAGRGRRFCADGARVAVCVLPPVSVVPATVSNRVRA
jgi:hypothetical protein